MTTQKSTEITILGIKEQIRKYRMLIHALEYTVRDLEQPIKHDGSSDNAMILDNNTRETQSDGYDKGLSLVNKVLFLVKKNNRFLHIRELANQIIEQEPDIDKNSKKPLSRRLATVMYIAKKVSPNLMNKQIGNSNRNNFWGNKNWLNGNGKIKTEHMFDKEYFYRTGTEKVEL